MTKSTGEQQRRQALTRRVLEGDRQALAELLSLEQGRLYHVILRMVRHAEDAAELTQETMLRVLQHVDRYDGRCLFSTWLIRIGMNLALSHLRKQKVRRAASLDAPAGDAAGDGEGGPLSMSSFLAQERELGPHDRVETDELLGLLRDVLGELEPEMRGVLVLRDLEGMDYEQIAQTLELPMGTVKSRLFRARLALRQAMQRRIEGSGRRSG